jgi:hypothetical protein
MYANAPAGLRVRSSAGLDGERIGALEHNAKVIVAREMIQAVTLDGLTGKWVYIFTPEIEGWVFNGYLAAEAPVKQQDNLESFILGEWIFWSGDGDYSFFADGHYVRGNGQSESFGSWKLSGNELTLTETGSGFADFESGYNSSLHENPIITKILVTVVDDEAMVFHIPTKSYGEENLQRREAYRAWREISQALLRGR